MLLRSQDSTKAETSATGVELYKANLKISKFRLLSGNELKEGDVSMIFKLMSFPDIEQPGCKTKDGYNFGSGKSVLFPAIPGCKAQLELSLSNKRKILGSMIAYLDELLKYLVPGASEIVKCSVVLANCEKKRVAVVDLVLGMTRIGPYKTEEFIQKKPKIQDSKDGRNRFVFKSKEETPKIHVELNAPRGKPKPILPPYHGDVAVQTVNTKGKGKKDKKKK